MQGGAVTLCNPACNPLYSSRVTVCQVAFLEMERIFITLESELLASSTLVDLRLAEPQASPSPLTPTLTLTPNLHQDGDIEKKELRVQHRQGVVALLGSAPASAPAPPQRAPGGPVQRGTPRVVGPGQWGPSHGLSCSSETPPKSPTPPPLVLQARRLRQVLRAPPGHWGGAQLQVERRASSVERRASSAAPPRSGRRSVLRSEGAFDCIGQTIARTAPARCCVCIMHHQLENHRLSPTRLPG